MGENSSENIIFEIGKTDIVQSRQQKKADRKREKTKRLLSMENQQKIDTKLSFVKPHFVDIVEIMNTLKDLETYTHMRKLNKFIKK